MSQIALKEHCFYYSSTMTAPAQDINIAETFFHAVRTGVDSDGLQELLSSYEPHERDKIVNSLSSEGETAMIFAVKENYREMVELLFNDLNADINKSGRFKWKGIIYEEVLPLFVAILSDNTPDQCIINFLVAKASIDSIATTSSSIPRLLSVSCRPFNTHSKRGTCDTFICNW